MAQSKQQLTEDPKQPMLPGTGGRERNPDAASPSAERPRNSSGSASVAASLLDLRQQMLQQRQILMAVCRALGDNENLEALERTARQGFRRGR